MASDFIDTDRWRAQIAKGAVVHHADGIADLCGEVDRRRAEAQMWERITRTLWANTDKSRRESEGLRLCFRASDFAALAALEADR